MDVDNELQRLAATRPVRHGFVPLYLALLLLASIWSSAEAHNGATAVAAHVEGLTLDGDLSDWPDTLTRYPIAWRGVWSPPSSDGDFQAQYRVAYSTQENALYLAVEVRDDDPAARIADDQLWHQDGCEVYLDLKHAPSTMRTPELAADQYAQYGDSLYHNNVEWMPTKTRQGRSGVESAVTRTVDTRVYEWRLDLGLLAGDELGPTDRAVIGLDVSVGDADTDGSFSWCAWGAGAYKAYDTRHVGDLLLADVPTGRVTGAARWTTGPPYVDAVHLQAVDDSTALYAVMPDRQGRLEARVPVGTYSVTPDAGSLATATTLTVTLDAATRIDLLVEPWSARTVAAGPGSTWTIGTGTWRGSWRSLTTSDGLPGAVRWMAEDRHGALWLAGTWPGVARLEGQSQTLLRPEDGMPDSPVRSHLEDSAGNLWFGTFDGQVVRYDGDSLAVLPLPPMSTVIRAIREAPDGAIWLAGGYFLARYDSGVFRSFGPSEGYVGEMDLVDMLVDTDGTVWTAGGLRGGLQRLEGERFTRLDGVGRVPALRAHRLTRDRAGRLWVGTGEQGMGFGSGAWRLDGGGVTRFTTADGLPDDTIRALLAAADGSIWLGTPEGVSRYDGDRVFSFRAADGLGDNHVSCMIEDRRHRIWFGTAAGLTVYDPHRLTVFTREDGLAHEHVAHLCRDAAGGLWIGHRQGDLSHFDGRAFQALPRPSGDRATVLDMAVDQGGDPWQATNRGLVQFHEGRYVTHELPDDWWARVILGVAASRDGSVWFTRPMSLGHFRGGKQRVYTASDGLAREQSGPVFEDRSGTVWVGHSEGSVSHGSGGVFTADQTEIRHLWAIAQSENGDLWFGGLEGAVRFDGQSFHTLRLRGQVHDIAEDVRGTLWLAANTGGVARYDGAALQYLAERDGIPGGCAHAVERGDDGDMWIGTGRGLVRYRPSDEPPAVAVVGVVADQRYGPVPEVTVTALTDVVTVEFEGRSSTTSPEGMVYLYRLVGQDTTWTQTSLPRVEYRSLPTGDYVFEVQAVDRDLNYSVEPASLTLKVTPPYSQVALVAALAIALLMVAWQGQRAVQRGRHLRASNRDLQERTDQLEAANRQVQEATRNKSEFLRRMSHDLRSPMNAIIGYTRLVLRKARGVLDDRQVRNLENIQTSSERLLDLINDILDLSRIEAGRLDLQVRDTELRPLVSECADALAPLVKPGVKLVRELEDVPLINTDPDRLRQVVMNLLGNAVKFTDEGTITVSLRATVDGAEVRVADTGVGIPPEDLPHIFDEFRQVQRQGGEQTEGTGLGLSIARKIVELLGGTIAAASEVGAGTTFTVQIRRG